MASLHQHCPHCHHFNRTIARWCGRCGGRLAAVPVAAAATEEEWPPEMLVGHPPGYCIERMVSKDGFGQTYLAYDIAAHRRPCIIKRLITPVAWGEETQRQAMTSFDCEARMLLRLNTPGHAHIPQMYAYLPQHHALVMQYIPGTGLDWLMQQQASGLPLVEALHYARAACGALVYMHSRAPEPVLHRAVQPAHMRLDEVGKLWLIGFGLAKALPRQLPRQHAQTLPTIGTPGYTAPEQWRGSAVPRSDVYGLGASLYTLLTGERPMPALVFRDDAELGLRPDIASLIRRTLALEAAERPNAAVLLAELERLLVAAQNDLLSGEGEKTRARGA
jgi:serine/threonine protein kinase